MKKTFLIIIFLLIGQIVQAQLTSRYGLTAGLNVSSAILPDLKINTDINSILHGESVIEGDPQLADLVALYKIGFFYRIDGKIGSIKLNANYTKTNIHKDLDLIVYTIDELNLQLDYLDFDITYQLNIFKHFYLSLGYIPSFLLKQNNNLNINNFDQRLLAGVGFRLVHGITLDFNAIAGINEVINGSYIHNIMIPITLNIPLNK